jgi:hypothetical protein
MWLLSNEMKRNVFGLPMGDVSCVCVRVAECMCCFEAFQRGRNPIGLITYQRVINPTCALKQSSLTSVNVLNDAFRLAVVCKYDVSSWNTIWYTLLPAH